MSPPHPGAVNRPGNGTTSGVLKKLGESPRRHTRPDSGRWRARPGTWHSDKVRTRAYSERKKTGRELAVAPVPLPDRGEHPYPALLIRQRAERDEVARGWAISSVGEPTAKR